MRAIEVSHKITSSYQSSDSMRNQEERAKIAGNHWLRFDSKKFDSIIESNHEIILSNLRLYKILSERFSIFVPCTVDRGNYQEPQKSYGGQQPIAVYRITDFPFKF